MAQRLRMNRVGHNAPDQALVCRRNRGVRFVRRKKLHRSVARRVTFNRKLAINHCHNHMPMSRRYRTVHNQNILVKNPRISHRLPRSPHKKSRRRIRNQMLIQIQSPIRIILRRRRIPRRNRRKKELNSHPPRHQNRLQKESKQNPNRKRKQFKSKTTSHLPPAQPKMPKNRGVGVSRCRGATVKRSAAMSSTVGHGGSSAPKAEGSPASPETAQQIRNPHRRLVPHQSSDRKGADHPSKNIQSPDSDVRILRLFDVSAL